MEIFILIVVAVAGGGFTAAVASSKNRDPVGWFVLGALFPLFGLIAVAAMPAAAPPQGGSTPIRSAHDTQNKSFWESDYKMPPPRDDD